MANWLSLPLSRITNNARGNARAYLIDPSGWLTASGYTQTNIGTPAATSPMRVMFVSSIGSPLPALSATDFAHLWNSAAGTVSLSGCRSSDVLVQRLNLQPLFHQVILNNFDVNNPYAARVTVDANTTSYLYVSTNGEGYLSYYLDGTSLGLCSNTAMQTRYILKRDTSFVFENGIWLGEILDGRPTPATNNLAASFANSALNFFSSELNPLSMKTGTTNSQGVVLNGIGSFMFDYATWAAMDFVKNSSDAKKKAKKNSMGKIMESDAKTIMDYGGTKKDKLGLLNINTP